MSWTTPRAALSVLDQKKLAELTNQSGQQELLGVGNATNHIFTTPFAFGADLKVYVDAVLAPDTGYDVTIDYTKGERAVVTFHVPPDVDVRITASSTDAVNADNLDYAFKRAQSLVGGALDAQLYAVPTSDALNVPEPIMGWAAAIAWYLLASDPRRPGLLNAYPEIEKRYIDVWGGVDSDLKRVAKGNFSLRGILTVMDPAIPGALVTGFNSNPVVYGPLTYRGVN